MGKKKNELGMLASVMAEAYQQCWIDCGHSISKTARKMGVTYPTAKKYLRQLRLIKS